MKLASNDIRRSFLQYFERRQHRVVPSSPLVPHDDPTLLFTNAGMNQFKDVFLGREKRGYTRAATAQKCMRVSGKHNDLDNVGPSLWHHTFFEMLGNFSFGDYFKRDAIPFAWALLTDEWKLPSDRLHATVFRGEFGIPRDDEAYGVWKTFLPAERIGELGTADNFWQMGDTGPCGRCSEIYYYRGAQIRCADEASGGRCRGLECGCDRYIEIWNNVFMEFDRQADGSLEPLPAPSIDTGMGLERITAVLQGHPSNYDTDLFAPLLEAIGERAATRHRGTTAPSDVSMRVVADHARAMTFLIADGVAPSNEWRGYVLRKIMRRAMRHGKRLGIAEPFLHALVDTLVRDFGDAYPELTTSRDAVVGVVRSEEERFDAVLASGLPRLEELLDKHAASGRVVPGDAMFRLYDTYGLPRDFIEDMVDERKLTLDREGFDRAIEDQRKAARAKSKFKSGDAPTVWYVPDRQEIDVLKDTFEGHQTTVVQGISIALLYDERPVLATVLSEGESGWVVLPTTPFYIEAGGQVSDAGWIHAPYGEARVDRLVRIPVRHDFPRAHHIQVVKGEIRRGDVVTAQVDPDLRDATRRNHTATHLLHAALRQVLGSYVKQAGSLVAPERLRFDFFYLSTVHRDQLLEIERTVNEQVLRNTTLDIDEKPREEAVAAGAIALFGEKYGDRVRVVSIPGFSMELCGGTHVRATGDIGLFAILSEHGVAAGVRRIEAVTGMLAAEWAQAQRHVLEELQAAIADDEPRKKELEGLWTTGFPAEDRKQLGMEQPRTSVLTTWARLTAEARDLRRAVRQVRMNAALGELKGGAWDEAIAVAGVTLVAREVAGLDKDGLRVLVDQCRARIKSGVVILASPSDGKVTVVVGVTPDLTKRVPAGQVVKQIAPIVGGGGGGRPDFAEAGGKDPSKITEMLAAARGVIGKMLSA